MNLHGNYKFGWCIIALRNSGYRIQAAMLAMNALGITATQAVLWVDSVKIDKEPVTMQKFRELLDEYPCNMSEELVRDRLFRKISHWPEEGGKP
jgi:hypothetical protein